MCAIQIRLAYCFVLAFLFIQSASAAVPTTDWNAAISEGIALRQQGNIQQSIDLLAATRDSAGNPATQATAAGELGITLLQAHRYKAAEAPLKQAYDFFLTGTERARYAVFLGNLYTVRKQPDAASNFYQEALTIAGNDLNTQLIVGLNLARLAADDKRLEKLGAVSQQLSQSGDRPEHIRYHLNLGNQARLLGDQGLRLAYQHLDEARKLSEQADNSRLLVESLDALAQLYEDQGRTAEAGQLTQKATTLARSLESVNVADLLINLEWRQGRLLKSEDKAPAALAAYQRAVEQIEAVRQDIPIENEEGRSSFSQTLEPIYLGYVDLLLSQANNQPAAAQATYLRRAMDTFELIKQTELQDFLGDRCSIETAQGGSGGSIPAGTALLYPISLPDRLELLLETQAGIVRHITPVEREVLHSTAIAYANVLRRGAPDYIALAKQLYRWLLSPFDEAITEQDIQNLVVVPDGALRLVPVGALHDGKQFVIEKYAVSMVTGLTMTNSASTAGRKLVSLVAGVSEPGPVVNIMAQPSIVRILEPSTSASRGGLAQAVQTRSLSSAIAAPSVESTNNIDQHRDIERFRADLSLPGVKDEIEALKDILKGTTLLNADFTVGQFQRDFGTGDFRIVHIASHAVFGGSADSSFIMAYDDILSMNRLESMLKSENFQNNPMELLTLSACETAEGNFRAPLGFSGAAIKTRAKSVLGTLWPVEDNAAKSVMKKFYGGMVNAGLTKTEALRQAQLELLHSRQFDHPFFWAPFVLIGNWL
ncbi:conserved exported hypothetical protein [Candidatus Propionivibrio aalborgensis]|uniref:CHAT domain-containing protein n=1 Tax=Candidatus Propionivibrio aalborgensis TaxID=1860101 RepID=A0A1A8XNU9_9RHOO|nr:CHAT domain-containing protein [Candidatus Propionivibrio aalborgensis]SBT05628.1 conserved exported hypothetical protein [Candidatus Propionivibrio aalborgensis]